MPTPKPKINNQDPVESQMSSILEALEYHTRMISNLQNQLTNLTSEVVKLQEHAEQRKSRTTENQAETQSASVLQRSISVSSISSTSSEQVSSTLHRVQQKVNNEQTRSDGTLQGNKSKMGINKTKTSVTQSQSRHHICSIQPTKTLIIGDPIIKSINERGLKTNVLVHKYLELLWKQCQIRLSCTIWRTFQQLWFQLEEMTSQTVLNPNM